MLGTRHLLVLAGTSASTSTRTGGSRLMLGAALEEELAEDAQGISGPNPVSACLFPPCMYAPPRARA